MNFMVHDIQPPSRSLAMRCRRAVSIVWFSASLSTTLRFYTHEMGIIVHMTS